MQGKRSCSCQIKYPSKTFPPVGKNFQPSLNISMYFSSNFSLNFFLNFSINISMNLSMNFLVNISKFLDEFLYEFFWAGRELQAGKDRREVFGGLLYLARTRSFFRHNYFFGGKMDRPPCNELRSRRAVMNRIIN